VPETNVFTLLKSHYKVALLDSYLSSKDLIENIVQYHQEWRQKGGVELFKANNKRLRFAKMVIKLIDDLEPIRKALLKA
jgi:nitrogen fixation protein